MPKPIDTLAEKLFPDQHQTPTPEFMISGWHSFGLGVVLGAVAVANWVQPVVDLWKPANHTRTISVEVSCPVGETPGIDRSSAAGGVVYGHDLIKDTADGTHQTYKMPYIAIGCVGPDGKTIVDKASSLRLARDSDGARPPAAADGQSVSTMSLEVAFHGRTLPGDMPSFTPVAGARLAGASYQDSSAVNEVLFDQHMIKDLEVLSTRVEPKLD